jgi:acyl dehydratase
MISTHPHERFSAVVSLEPGATSAFAYAVGDTNPVHHDAAYAAASRFGRLLASGPQTTAHLLALTASHFSKRGAMLGLDSGSGFGGRSMPTRRSPWNGLSYP